MRRGTACAASVLAAVLVAAVGLFAQNVHGAAESELAAIAERGRALAEYDAAVWHASDALKMANPKTAEGQISIGKKENGRWTVAFGMLNADRSKFLIGYEAEQVVKSKECAVRKNEPALEDAGFYLFAARAMELASADFGSAGRPYNVAVLPLTGADAKDQQGLLYVYFYPAQTKTGIYPLGGDARYLVSPDGMKIIEKRQMHQTVADTAPAKGKKMVAGHHRHALSDVPEETDVLHVLQQDPPVPEMIVTPHFVYEIASDGTIRIKKQKK